ncbi:MAG: hypothetical protein KDK04_15215, partial [Candidatus Competibacteraceae bacterium]|nr:hypothetical protein [Candidatus Competibacteraceae bacterium]
ADTRPGRLSQSAGSVGTITERLPERCLKYRSYRLNSGNGVIFTTICTQDRESLGEISSASCGMPLILNINAYLTISINKARLPPVQN